MTIRLGALVVLLFSWQSQAEWKTEKLGGDGVWIDPRFENAKATPDREFLVTVWFEDQFLGDGAAFLRRAKEFDSAGRTAMRKAVEVALKEAAQSSQQAAREKLDALVKEKTISGLRFFWIVNGFACVTNAEGAKQLGTVPGVKKIFLAGPALTFFRGRTPAKIEPPKKSEPSPFDPDAFAPLWYIEKLKADRVWKELKVTGKGTLNVVHDGNFVHSPWIDGNLFFRPDETRNDRDDDGNGLIDDVNGYDFFGKLAPADATTPGGGPYAGSGSSRASMRWNYLWAWFEGISGSAGIGSRFKMGRGRCVAKNRGGRAVGRRAESGHLQHEFFPSQSGRLPLALAQGDGARSVLRSSLRIGGREFREKSADPGSDANSRGHSICGFRGGGCSA